MKYAKLLPSRDGRILSLTSCFIGLPPFSVASAGKTGPTTMIAFAGSNVNSESWASLLCELLLDPPSYSDERIERSPANVDAGQLVKTFQILDNIVRVGAAAHVRDPQEMQ